MSLKSNQESIHQSILTVQQKMIENLTIQGVANTSNKTLIELTDKILEIEAGKGDQIIINVEELPVGFRDYMSFPTDRARVITSTGRVFLQENGQRFTSGEFPRLAGVPGTDILQAESVVPSMTSDTTPIPFIASASSRSSNSYPYHVFKDMENTSGTWGSSTSEVFPQWVSIKLDVPRRVNLYKLKTASAPIPKSWILKGSNDENNWDVLHEVVGASLSGSTVYSYNPTIIEEYLYYRIEVIEAATTHKYAYISRLALIDEGLFQLPDTPKDELGRAKWVLAN